MIAGMSVDYYNRMERGDLAGVSDVVVDSLARALRLDEAEHSYLRDLSKAANSSPVRHQPARTLQIEPTIQRVLDSMVNTPAYVRNARLDVLAMNDLARALYHPTSEADYPGQYNIARYIFVDPTAPEQLPAWDQLADDTVAILRHQVGRDPHDAELAGLIGELARESALFAEMWADQKVRFHRSGSKPFRHPAVGDFELWFHAMHFEGNDDLTMLVYTAEPGSKSADALALLTSVIATRDLSTKNREDA